MPTRKEQAADMIWKDTHLLGLTVTLKSKSGRSFREKGVRINRNNLDYFVPEKQKLREAKRELEKSGFKVIAESRLGLSIIGQKKLIEEFFNTKVGVRTVTVKHGKKTFKVRMPEGKLAIPKKLAGIIDRVTFEKYPIPLESATPPGVDYYHLNVPDDIASLLNAVELHSCGYDGSGIKLCMIDDGFYEHAYYTAMGYDITLIPLDGTDMPEGDGHGTAIASNALAIAPGVEFLFVNNKIYISVGSIVIPIAAPLAAFRRAKEENPDIITCSWGLNSYDEDLAWEIVDAVNNDGTVVTFACGNGGEVFFPGCMDEVISVGGVFPEEDGGFHASTYASSGECDGNPGRQCPDVCGLVGDDEDQRGVLIMMPTVPGGSYDGEFADYDGTANDDGWLCGSGTSSAAPQVAGVAALILQCNPMLTPDDVKTILQNTGIDIVNGQSASGEPAGPGVDLATGHGLVNAADAVEAAGCSCTSCNLFETVIPCNVSVEYCLASRMTWRCGWEVCRPGIMPCHPFLITGPGGCGPRSLIVDPFLSKIRLNPAAGERLARLTEPATRGKHVRKLTMSRRGRRARPGIRTKRLGRKLLR